MNRLPSPAGLARRDLVALLSAPEDVWGPRVVQGLVGTRQGQRLVEMTTAAGLDATVAADQYLDLDLVTWRGVPISFHSPHTSRLDPEWLRRWPGGLLTTCGLANVGPAQPDGSGMHGRALSIPATELSARGAWRDGHYEVTVSGRMREAVLFGHNLTIERTIRARIGSPELMLSDVVTNAGFTQERVFLLYHINLGWPLVAEGATISVGDTVTVVGAPTVGAAETVTTLRPRPDHGEWAHAQLTSPTGTRFDVGWRPSQLPCFTVWRSEAAGNYAVGLEPGTCWPLGADTERSAGRGRVLEPGQTLSTDIRIAVHDLPDEEDAGGTQNV